jgi:hypothetical protein
MNALVVLLTQIMMGRVEGASNRITHKVWWRIPVYLVIFGSAAWVAVASALLWTSDAYPGIVGLLAFVRRGGPAWLLCIPLVAALTALAGCLPAAGRYGLVFVFQTATFALTLAGLAVFQANGHALLNLAAISSFLVTLPASLLAIVTALADTPPVDSPLAYVTLTYFGRVRHLRALSASARRLGWEISGPAGAARAMLVGGYYGGRRHAQVVSGWSMQGATAADSGYWFKLTVTSPSPLPAFRIARQKVPPEVAARAVTGAVTGGLNSLRFYVLPRYGQQISQAWTERFIQHIASGKGYLRTARETVQLAPGGLLYTHFSMLRLTAKSGEFEPLLDWLIGVAMLLEEIAPDAETVAPPPTTDYTPRRPYGQISPVDPTSRSW